MADRSPPDRLNLTSFKQRNSATESEEIDVTTAGVLKSGGDGAAAADPEGGRRAAAHVGDGAREVATARARVTKCVFYSSNRQV